MFDEQINNLNSVLSPIQVPTELFRLVSPAISGLVGDRTDFVHEEPLDLQCLPTSLAICVVEDVSIHLDNLTLQF